MTHTAAMRRAESEGLPRAGQQCSNARVRHGELQSELKYSFSRLESVFDQSEDLAASGANHLL